MKNFILPLLAILYSSVLFSQNSFRAIIKDGETREVLYGANAIIEGTVNGASSNQNGFLEITDIQNGTQTIILVLSVTRKKAKSMNFR